MKPKLQTVQKHFASPALLFANFRKSAVPEGGWTHEAFLSPAGAQLIRDLLSVQNAAKLKGTRLLANPLTALLKRQVLETIDIFEIKLRRSYGYRSVSHEGSKAPQLLHASLVISSQQHQDLWAAAIEDAFSNEGHTVLATVRSPLQSVADDVLEKTTALLSGKKPHPGTRRTLQMEIAEIAKDVTGINETTRKNLARIIRRGIDEGESPFAMMETVRKKLPQIATNRVPTIVRTEMGRAVDRATIRSFKEGGEVTHVSVIGCQAIEKGIPTFNGVPTCNIKNVPIEFANSLRFHPNHTGAIVSSGFKTRDGGRPPLPLRGGPGIGTWEDRGKPVPAVFNDPVPGPPVTAPALTGVQSPTRQVVWSDNVERHADEILNEVPFTKPKPGFWKKIKDVDTGEVPLVSPAGVKKASGLVIREADGRVWIVEPTDHAGGFENTFPSQTKAPGLTSQQTALRAAFYAAGLEARITSVIADITESDRISRYYLAERVGGSPWLHDEKTQSVKLVPTASLGFMMNHSRDKEILEALENGFSVTE